MEHNTDRILWTVLILAIGVALYVLFRNAANPMLTSVMGKIKGVVDGVSSTTTSAIFPPFF